MNPLYVLEDKVNLHQNSEDFIVVKKDFQLVDLVVDLAVTNLNTPYQDNNFYSIPLINREDLLGSNLNDLARLCESYHRRSKKLKRFLVNVADHQYPILIEAKGSRKTYFQQYFSHNRVKYMGYNLTLYDGRCILRNR